MNKPIDGDDETMVNQATAIPKELRAKIDELNRQAWAERTTDAGRSPELARMAREMASEAEYERGLADALTTEAYIAALKGSYDEAREGSDRAIETLHALGDRILEARALTVRAVVAIWDGELDRQREYLERALELSRETGDKEIEATTINALGNHARTVGDLQKARELYQQALDIAIEHGFTAYEALDYVSVGSVTLLLGDAPKALELVLRAAEIAKQLQDARLLAHAQGTLSAIYEALGDFALALANEVDAFRYHEASGRRQMVCQGLLNIAAFNFRLGKYDAALDASMRGLGMAESLGLKEFVAQGLLVLGAIFGAIGEPAREVDCFMRGLRIAQEIGQQMLEAHVLGYLGQAYHTRGDIPKALVYYFKALEIERQCGSMHGVQEDLRRIGEIYGAVEEPEEAEEYLAESLRLARSMSYQTGEIESLIALGALASSHGDHGEGIEHLTAALELAREGRFLEGCRQAAAELAKVYRKSGDEKSAKLYEREHRHFTQSIFNEDANLRVRDLLRRFEEDSSIHEGRRLGLNDEALDKVSAVAGRFGMRARQAAEQESRAAIPPEALQGTALRAEASPSRSAEQVTLRVATFGIFRLTLDGRELSRGDWKRKRARDLFKLLLVNHRMAVSVDEIHDKLWGGERDGRNIELLVMNAATHIRKALETGRSGPPPGFSLLCVDGAYVLDLGVDAEVDFLRFKELIVMARKARTAEERTRRYEEAIELYHGDFLQEDLFTGWTDYYRQMLKDAFLEGLEYLAAEHLRTGRAEDAIECARRILRHDELNESAYRALFIALRHCGRTGEAQRAYEECRAMYERETGGEPPRELMELMMEAR